MERVFRRGKFIRVDLEGGCGMAVHLRMTGWLGVLDSSARDPKQEPYIRLRMLLDDGKDTLVFRDVRTFGRVWAGKTGKLEAMKSLAKLGPEPLTIDPETFYQRVHAKRARLKPLLLNQEFLAGVGNIYADESLFDSGLHPLTNTTRLKRKRADALLASIQKILNAAIKAGGSSIDDFLHPDGEPGWFQRELMVYGREGQPCKRCGTAIKRFVLGQRGTWFCPKCQRK